MNHSVSRRDFIGLAGTMALAAVGLAGCAGSRGGGAASSASTSSAPSAESSSTTSADAASNPSSAAASAGGKSVIVLWSWSGNTLKMAERVSELSGAGIYRIEAADPYPEDYDACADRAKQETDSRTYPEIANPIQNWDDYNTVFVGYPIWWYELPMIVQGFVKDHNWSGKTIVPFNSHEGSGDGGTYADLREMTGATVLDGLAIRGGDVATSLNKVNDWYAALPL